MECVKLPPRTGPVKELWQKSAHSEGRPLPSNRKYIDLDDDDDYKKD